MSNHILLADDDVELCQLLKDYLEQEELQVDCVHDGATAVKTATEKSYSLLILDVMMPLKNGFETLSELRQTSQLPVIMLTAKGEKIDRIVGLEMGADDYIAKPCDPRELLARIRAVIRRTAQSSITHVEEEEAIEINELVVDAKNRLAQLRIDQKDQEIDLTSTEFDILFLLMKNSGKLVSKEKISEYCLGKKLQPFDRSIDMHLSNIRRKLGNFKDNKPRIKTVRGSGYQFLAWQ